MTETKQRRTPALQAVTNHFNSQEVRSVDVPEWGMKVFAKRLNIHDRGKLFEDTRDLDSYKSSVRVLIVAAVDEQGEPIFTLEDRQTLTQKADPDVVMRVAGFLLSASPTVDAEKN